MICLRNIILFIILCLNIPFVFSKGDGTTFTFDKAIKTPAFQMEGYWVWGSSVVKSPDGKYHMYVSRFPKTLPFHPGWMVASEIVHAVADNPTGPFKFSDIALPARGAEYWDGRSTHNPRILFYNNKYYLIYMGSTHPFSEPTYDELTLDSKWCPVARSNKRIGLAVSDSPYGPWERYDQPILDVKPNTFYSYLISNPTPVIRKDGTVVIMFKGRSYVGNDKYSRMHFGIATAPNIEGPYKVLNNDKPVWDINVLGEGEDPFIWEDENGFHVLFKDQKGKITGETGAGVLAHSKDLINWNLDEHPKAYSRNIVWNDGSQSKQGQLERPFIMFDEKGKPCCIYFATMNGKGGFNNATDSWNMVIPIK